MQTFLLSSMVFVIVYGVGAYLYAVFGPAYRDCKKKNYIKFK